MLNVIEIRTILQCTCIVVCVSAPFQMSPAFLSWMGQFALWCKNTTKLTYSLKHFFNAGFESPSWGQIIMRSLWGHSERSCCLFETLPGQPKVNGPIEKFLSFMEGHWFWFYLTVKNTGWNICFVYLDYVFQLLWAEHKEKQGVEHFAVPKCSRISTAALVSVILPSTCFSSPHLPIKAFWFNLWHKLMTSFPLSPTQKN